ncbi:MAG: type IV toxin-antitoxin system AbiEi family antitoxin [Caldilineales bacterium]
MSNQLDQTPPTQYGRAQGVALLERLVAETGPIFTTEDAIGAGAELGLARPAVNGLLAQLAQGPWLERLKRGVYIVQSPLLSTEIHPFALAAALVQPCAISHWSALAFHGMTTQIPTMIQASTPRAVVTPEMRSGHAYRPRGRAVWRALDLEFEFIAVQPVQFFGLQQEWVTQWHQVALTDRERTVLDVMAHPQVFGGMGASIELLEANWKATDGNRLVSYALHYGVGATIKRLGYWLESFGAPADLLQPLAEYPVSGYIPLDPASSSRGEADSRWRIRANLAGRKIHGNR